MSATAVSTATIRFRSNPTGSSSSATQARRSDVEIADGTLACRRQAHRDELSRRTTPARRRARRALARSRSEGDRARSDLDRVQTRSARSPPRSRTTAKQRAPVPSASPPRPRDRQEDRRLRQLRSLAGRRHRSAGQSTVQTLVPEIVGNVTAQGTQSRIQRRRRSGGRARGACRVASRRASIARSRSKAASSKRRAMALCPRLRALGHAEAELEVRLADGSRLDLVRVD